MVSYRIIVSLYKLVRSYVGRKLSRRYKIKLLTIWETLHLKSFFSIKLTRDISKNPKIGMAVLAYERPDYLEACLDALFSTNLYDYNITFLLQDDGSTDPRVRKILNRVRDPRFRIIRYFTRKGHHSAGAAINKAMRRLMEIDDFEIIGWCESDTIHHPEWLDKLMNIAIWAKSNHRKNLIGPFSAFNSSDKSHKIYGEYLSPKGSYVVKGMTGMVNYFYYKDDFIKLGFFEEDIACEEIMHRKFNKLRVRTLCLKESHVEHIGIKSSLIDWRRINRKLNLPSKFVISPHGINLPKGGWTKSIKNFKTLGYYKYIKRTKTFGFGIEESKKELDIVILVTNNDLKMLHKTLKFLKNNLLHPFHTINLIILDDSFIPDDYLNLNCNIIQANNILPINSNMIHVSKNNNLKRIEVIKELLKLSINKISDLENVLVIDSRIIFISPQKFEYNNKFVYLLSGKYFYPNIIFIYKLLGIKSKFQLSFETNHMVINQNQLLSLKNYIENKNNENWYESIIKCLNDFPMTSFSSFETFGYWMFNNYPNDMHHEYYFQQSYTVNESSNPKSINSFLNSSFRSASISNSVFVIILIIITNFRYFLFYH